MGNGLTRVDKIKADATAAHYEAPAFEEANENRQKPARAVCKREAQRLIGKPFAPSDAIAVGVIIDSVRDYAHNEGHVQRMVTWLLTNIERWPDVPDVREAAYQTRDSEMRANPACADCGGSGYAPVARWIDGVKYEAARKCHCWRYVKVTA
jgi:hypothetical protein